MKTSDIPKRVTRNDVAKRAGVSPAVVSYVINSSKYVSEEKTLAVKKAIEELQYRPNIQARGLKTNRTMQVAFVCDNLRNDWLEGAETLLFEKGYYVSHCYSRDGEDFIQMLIARRFDGIFMMSNRFSTAQLNEIAEAGIPVVLYKTRKYGELNPKIISLVPDLMDGVKKSVNYLAMRGYRKIALIPPIRYRTQGLSDDGFRVRAYMDAMKQNGLALKEEFVCTETESIDSIMKSVVNMMLQGDKEKRPSAFICGNDYIAIQVIQELKKLGLQVPENVGVIGNDNIYLAEVISPTLTTVDFSKEEYVRKLSEKLLQLMNGKIPEDEYLKVSIVVRESA